MSRTEERKQDRRIAGRELMILREKAEKEFSKHSYSSELCENTKVTYYVNQVCVGLYGENNRINRVSLRNIDRGLKTVDIKTLYYYLKALDMNDNAIKNHFVRIVKML